MCCGLDTICGARFIALSVSHRSLFMNVGSAGVNRDALCVIMYSVTRRRNVLERRDHNALRVGGVVDQGSAGVNRDALCVIMYSVTRRRNVLQRRDHNALHVGGVGTFRHCCSFFGSRVMGVLDSGLVFMSWTQKPVCHSADKQSQRGGH